MPEGLTPLRTMTEIHIEKLTKNRGERNEGPIKGGDGENRRMNLIFAGDLLMGVYANLVKSKLINSRCRKIRLTFADVVLFTMSHLISLPNPEIFTSPPLLYSLTPLLLSPYPKKHILHP